jgi:hypothetical protein
VLKKHGAISSNAPPKSKYFFADGEERFYIRSLNEQRLINRRILLLAFHRTYQWSLANQIKDGEARRA